MSQNHLGVLTSRTVHSRKDASLISLATFKKDDDSETDIINQSVPKRPMEVSSEENLGQLMNIPMRFAGFGALLEGLSKSGISSSITKGCIVIPRVDIPEMRIVEAQNYEVMDIYLQGTSEEALIERVSLETLDDPRPVGTETYTLYLKLYNPRYNDEPVIVTPEEVGLVSVKDEIVEALIFAVPGLAFWICVSILFYSYGSITGGDSSQLNNIPTIEMQQQLRTAPTTVDSYGLPIL